MDGEHLFGLSGDSPAAPYAVNAFIPLVDTSLELRNGPTEFVAGTHTPAAAHEREAARAEGGGDHMLAGATRDAEAPALTAGASFKGVSITSL